MLRHITSTPSHLWLGRGAGGATKQEVTAVRAGGRARLTVRGVGEAAGPITHLCAQALARSVMKNREGQL